MKYFYELVILDAVMDYDIEYIYFSEEKMSIGSICFVPFGKNDKLVEAVIVGESDEYKKAKKIFAKSGEITLEQVKTAKYISTYNVNSIASILRIMIPKACRSMIGRNKREIEERVKLPKKAFVSTLISKEDLHREKTILDERQKILSEIINELILNFPNSIEKKKKYNKRHIDYLRNRNIADLVYRAEPLSSNFEKKEIFLPDLTYEQREIYNSIINSGNKNILFGVSGSGKSVIYMHLARKYISENKNVLITFPDLALLPYHREIFREYFGEMIVYIHSRMSDREKKIAIKKLNATSPKVVIGTRNTVLLFERSPDIIIVDEYHSSNYISEHPRFDIRKCLEHYHSKTSKLIFSSATPLVSNYYDESFKKHILLKEYRKREKRYTVVDLSEEFSSGNKRYLSRELIKNIDTSLRKSEKVFLLLNRSSHFSHIFCRNCGKVLRCENCENPLYYDKKRDSFGCKVCSVTKKVGSSCVYCGSKTLKFYSGGTDVLKAQLLHLFPNARIKIASASVLNRKSDYDELYEDINESKYDIIIGTSVISRGYDFDIGLSACVYSDNILFQPNYMASEETFSLLQQFFSRAGHYGLGRCILQTYSPENYVMQSVMQDDYLSFYNKEISVREERGYPPFVNYTVIKVFSKNEEDSLKTANYLKKKIEGSSDKVIGPYIPINYKIRDEYYYYIRCEDISENKILKAKLMEFRKKEKVKFSVDVDATQIY